MSQDAIVDWLRKQRLTGDDGFFTLQQIRHGVGPDNISVRNGYDQCLQLYRFGIVEMRCENMLNKSYRLKKKYVGKNGGDA